jgi:hypothetical protein
MKHFEWVILDTETTGFAAPVLVVEIGAQKRRPYQNASKL